MYEQTLHMGKCHTSVRLRQTSSSHNAQTPPSGDLIHRDNSTAGSRVNWTITSSEVFN